MVPVQLSGSSADEVEQATQPTIRIPLARDELGFENEVLGVGGAVGRPTIREETNSIPVDWLDSALRDERGEVVDPVAARVDTETVDLPLAVECGDCRSPVTLMGVPQSHHRGTL